MRYVLAVLALAGAVVSGLALRVHYSTDTTACAINAQWDCGVVNHSPFAEIAHVPVAAIGVAGYVVLLGLALGRQRFLTMLLAGAAFCFALRLTFIEEFALGAWCVYCVISQTIIALMLLLSLGWVANEYWRLRRKTARLLD